MDHVIPLHPLPPHISRKLSAVVFASRPLQEVPERVLEVALDFSGTQCGSLYWVNRRTNTLELKAIRIAPGTCTSSAASASALALTDPSILAEVVRTKQLQLIPDLSTEEWQPRNPHVGPATPMGSVLAVPLFSHDGKVVVGVLHVESREPHVFTEEKQADLIALAQRAQMVVQRATLSAALRNLAQKALTMDLDALLAYTTEALADLLDVGVCSIWLTDPLTDDLVLKQAAGRPIGGRHTPDVRISRHGFLGRALNSTDLSYSLNVQQEPDFLYRDYATRQGWTSALVVPIRSSTDDRLGVISVYAVNEERSFTEQDRSLAIVFANHVAIVLQQVTLLADKERRVEIETSLKRVSDALATAEDFDGLLHPIVTEAMHLLRAAGAILYLRDEHARENVVKAVAGIAERVQGMRTPLEGSLSGWVAVQNRPELCDANDLRVDQRIAGRMHLRSNVAAAPLALKERVIGTLVVLDKQQGTALFDQTDLQVLQTLATQATIAIDKARLYEATERYTRQQQVINDILTASVFSHNIDDILFKAARRIHSAFGYKVALCLIEQGELVFKTTVFYNGTVRRNAPILKLGQGIAGLVARTGKPVVVPDVKNTHLPYQRDLPETRSEVALPLLARAGHPIGVFDSESQEVNTFSKADVQIFQPIAAGIALAIENVQRLKEHTALRTIADVVSQAQDLSHMLDNIVPTVMGLFQASACSLYLAEPMPHL